VTDGFEMENLHGDSEESVFEAGQQEKAPRKPEQPDNTVPSLMQSVGESFQERIDAAHRRLAELSDRVGQLAVGQSHGLAETVAEVAAALRELRVTEDELAEKIEIAAERERAEEALLQYQQQTTLQDLLAVMDRNYVFLWVNEAYARYLGRDRDDIVGQPVSEVIGDEDFSRIKPYVDRCIEGGEPVRCELTEIRAVGEKLRLEQTFYPVKDGSGNVVSVLAVVRDVTGYRGLDERRQATIEFLRLVSSARSASELVRKAVRFLKRYTGCDAVGVRLRQGDDFPYVGADGFADEFLQKERYLCARDREGEILRDESGNPILECLCGRVIAGCFEPLEPFFTEGHSFWTNSVSEFLASVPGEECWKRMTNGCYGEGYRSVALIPLRSGDETLGLLGIHDRRQGRFTEEGIAFLEGLGGTLSVGLMRLRAEEALRASEERYRIVADNTYDWEFWMDPEGRFIYCSPSCERITGYSPAEFEADPELMGRIVHPEDSDRYAAHLNSRVRENGLKQLQLRIIRRDGSERWVEHICRPVHDAEGRFLGYRGSNADITDRRRLEEQLRQAQKMESIGRLAGGVAHDFNNLLTAIVGHAEFALQSMTSTEPARADIEEVIRTTERASRLTRHLLALSRRQVMSPRVISLNELILDMDRLLRRVIPDNIELVTSPAEDLNRVRVDPGHIEQVLMNLVVNACDAMPDGGTLTIETTNVTLDEEYAGRHVEVVPGEYVMLAVTDTGIGMSEEVKAHLFEPFFTTKEAGRGTGLGLATVYGIVKQHGGSIWVYSELGVGTTFKIYLPQVEAPDEGLPRRDDEEGRLVQGRETVLVVEDEPWVRGVERRILESQGYTVLEASNGGEALEVARKHPGQIHLLLTDVVMARMSGKELAAELEADHPGLKVLFISGYTENYIVHGSILEPGAAFLAKPFTAAALARKVREVLDA